MQSLSYDPPAKTRQAFRWPSVSTALTPQRVQRVLVILASVGVGLAVIVSTYYADNAKLLVGMVGGVAFVLLTMRWPEFGILSFVALLSGLISLGWLPVLPLGPVSLNISDVVLMLLLALVFLRTTTQRSFVLFGSPITLPLLLFIGAFILSAANAILVYDVQVNSVLRTARVLALWVLFVPALQLVRDEQALRRLLIGLLMLTGILLVGVLFPNWFEPFLYVEERAAGTGAETYSNFTRLYFSGDLVLYAMIPVTVASLATIKTGNQLWRIGLLGLLCFWAFKTLFRSYWLTLFITCVLLLVFLSSVERLRLLKRLAPAMLAGMVLLTILMLAQPAQVERVFYVAADRVGSLLHDPIRRESSLQWRVIENRYALAQIGQHPVLGLGLANSYRPPLEAEAETNFYGDWSSKYVENGYLWIAVMMGLVGLIPFIWLSTTYLLRVFRYYHEIQDDGFRAAYLGFGVAFVGQLICNIVTPNFVIGHRLIFFPLTIAISEAILRLAREKEAVR